MFSSPFIIIIIIFFFFFFFFSSFSFIFVVVVVVVVVVSASPHSRAHQASAKAHDQLSKLRSEAERAEHDRRAEQVNQRNTGTGGSF